MSYFPKNKLKLLQRPSRSSDLSIIENLGVDLSEPGSLRIPLADQQEELNLAAGTLKFKF